MYNEGNWAETLVQSVLGVMLNVEAAGESPLPIRGRERTAAVTSPLLSVLWAHDRVQEADKVNKYDSLFISASGKQKCPREAFGESSDFTAKQLRLPREMKAESTSCVGVSVTDGVLPTCCSERIN